jgi:hypothetical protein
MKVSVVFDDGVMVVDRIALQGSDLSNLRDKQNDP